MSMFRQAGRTARERKKRMTGRKQDVCTCQPGTRAGRTDTQCSGCQNNTRRSKKRSH